MNKPCKNIVIVGGGSAGWLTAGILAAEHCRTKDSQVKITLVESSDVAPVGVGEGTWPSMRSTLQHIGISETDFLLACDASFKQGSKFCQWHEKEGGHYYHPFTLPHNYNEFNLAPYWQPFRDNISFADAVCQQSHLGEHGLAPKQITTPEYAFNANYGYHLDAGKFATFLKEHCTKKLHVQHVIDHVEQIQSAENGDITSLTLTNGNEIFGDLFIDCSGSAAILLAKHFDISFVNKQSILFNDTALAVHVPYEHENSPIASFTHSTAQRAGWIWDIALPSRRGVGYTYSSAHTADHEAEQDLKNYLDKTANHLNAESIDVRKLTINPGHREKFWHKNCIAVGMSAGFIEPLEASALVLIELSAKMISEQLPENRQTMDIIAKRFNTKFLQRWQNIVDFLKLHYVLSQRTDSNYWLDNRESSSISDNLQEQLTLWKYHVPYKYDAVFTEEMFPPASYQYILYGMGFNTLTSRYQQDDDRKNADKLFHENVVRTNQLLQQLPKNRELLKKIKQFGLSKI